ncbi:MAG: hypothetical protein EPN21_20415 [Methylococcaceae bacterium]|nr:MAG: hypothetical protein EPN21_20415 [Methylococcaceae bacterium]
MNKITDTFTKLNPASETTAPLPADGQDFAPQLSAADAGGFLALSPEALQGTIATDTAGAPEVHILPVVENADAAFDCKRAATDDAADIWDADGAVLPIDIVDNAEISLDTAPGVAACEGEDAAAWLDFEPTIVDELPIVPEMATRLAFGAVATDPNSVTPGEYSAVDSPLEIAPLEDSVFFNLGFAVGEAEDAAAARDFEPVIVDELPIAPDAESITLAVDTLDTAETLVDTATVDLAIDFIPVTCLIAPETFDFTDAMVDDSAMAYVETEEVFPTEPEVLDEFSISLVTAEPGDSDAAWTTDVAAEADAFCAIFQPAPAAAGDEVYADDGGVPCYETLDFGLNGDTVQLAVLGAPALNTLDLIAA